MPRDDTNGRELDQEHYQRLARLLDEDLERAAGRRMGFALLVFPFDAPGIGHYVANAERDDMITALRETADRLAKQQRPLGKRS